MTTKSDGDVAAKARLAQEGERKGDQFGDRMKVYENAECSRRFLPLLPICVRLDGRSFSAFTHGMERPYDTRLFSCFDYVTKRLVEETGALVGYTQSDEISLILYSDKHDSQVFFDGKVFKITSVLASMATCLFVDIARHHWPDRIHDRLVSFDCRAFQVPNQTEAANVILWREMDATKNAASMAARHYFSHKALHQQGQADMQEMLFQHHGVNFNDYPARFKRGQFFLRRTAFKELEPEILAKIPEDKMPPGPIERQIVAAVDMPKFRTVTNREAVIFANALPSSEQGEERGTRQTPSFEEPKS